VINIPYKLSVQVKLTLLNQTKTLYRLNPLRGRVRAGTEYPHVTWAHVMLRVQLGCGRRF